MKCPSCGSDDTWVKDSRPRDAGHLRRRRVCAGCRKRFTTYEVVAPERLSLISPLGIVSAIDADSFVDAIAGHARAAVRLWLRNFKAPVEPGEGDEAASTEEGRRCAS